MPDPAVDALATDPAARVMVFIDGQNLYQACRRLFGHPLCHPRLLAEYLAGPRTLNPVQCRFYTVRPNPNKPREAEKARNLDRRLHGIRESGVTVVLRELRYHWDWGHQQRLPPPEPGAAPQKVELTPWERPNEKGIDLVLGLDVVEFVLNDLCDVVIIVSLDRDLCEIPKAIRNLRQFVSRPVRLEAAVPTDRPRTIRDFHFTHQITQPVFDLVRDDTKYNVPDHLWVPPKVPLTLPPS